MIRHLATAAILMTGTASVAQDVVVMRRAIALPGRRPAPAPAPTPSPTATPDPGNVTCPTVPTSRHGLQNSANGWTVTRYDGNVANGLAKIRAMDGKARYYLLLKYTGYPDYNIIYTTNEAPVWMTGTPFAQVAGDGYYMCIGNR